MKEVFVNVNTKIYPDEILYCEADKNYTRIYYKSKMIIVPLTLKLIQQCLREYTYCRIHRSFLINTLQIRRVIDKYKVEMADTKILPVSRRSLTTFHEALKATTK